MADKEKIPLKMVKKLPYTTLMRMINKARDFLKEDGIMQETFKEYEVDIEELDYVPIYFKDLDVSAKTEKGIIYLNYTLLTDGDFFEDYSYLIHEVTHYLQQTASKKPTTSSDDEHYLDNKFEQEAFKKQVEYISEQFSKTKAEDYVEDLLEFHDIDDDKKKDELETLFLKNI